MQTQGRLLDRLRFMLAGRAAEALYLQVRLGHHLPLKMDDYHASDCREDLHWLRDVVNIFNAPGAAPASQIILISGREVYLPP